MMLTSLYSTKNCETTAAKSKIYFKNIVDIEWQLCELKTNNVWWWVNCQRMFQMHKWIKVLFTVESWWGKLGQVNKTFNLEKMVHATNIFTKTNCTNQTGKLFHPGMFDPASPHISRNSIIVIVVLSARVPGQTLLIKLRIEKINLLIIILMLIVSPWWQSEECEY